MYWQYASLCRDVTVLPTAERPRPGRTRSDQRLGSFELSTYDLWPCQWPLCVGTVAGMSIDSPAPISILSVTECWNLLGSVSLGRLVTSVDGQPEIFPVNFVVQHRSVLFRTAEGTKFVSSAINNQVLFEADGSTADEGWSVIVKGTAHSPRTDEELEEARRAWLFPWTATPKPHFVRIRPMSITGRRFVFGPEPDNESTFA